MRLREKSIQSCLVTLVIGAIFELFSRVFAFGHLQGWNLVMSTSIASTAFVLFAFPHSAANKYRTVIGGHAMSVIAGFVVISLATYLPLSKSWIYASVIGLSLLLMTLTDTIHPPGAGTALTIAMEQTTPLWANIVILIRVATVVLATVFLLTISHFLLRKQLVNLEQQNEAGDGAA